MTSVHLFSTGTEWDVWSSRNCSRCVKEPTCDLIAAIFGESLTDESIPHGSVSAETSERLGYSKEYAGMLGWPCAERQADAAPPKPAAHAMRDSGAILLPGFDS